MKPWPFFPKCVDKGKNREIREEKKNMRCKILIRRLAFLHKGAYWGKAPSGGAFFRGVCCGEPCAHQCRVPHRYAEGPSSGAKSGHFWTVYPRKLEICKFYPNVLPTRKLHLRFHLSHALLCCIFLLKHRDFWWDESVGIFYSNACLILKPQKQLVQCYTVFGIPKHCNFYVFSLSFVMESRLYLETEILISPQKVQKITFAWGNLPRHIYEFYLVTLEPTRNEFIGYIFL